jgi:hypothetical protein
MMNLRLILAASRYVVVAVLFAACGAWSAQFPMTERAGWMNCALPLPFAVLCALLFMRKAWAVLVVPLMVAVWFIAYQAATVVGFQTTPEEYLIPVGVGGFIGGLGVTLSASICSRRLLSPGCLLGAALIGCVGALPFGFWLRSYYAHSSPWFDPLQPFRLRYSFATWQAAVGTYLYAICASAKKKAPQAESENGHPR